MIDYIGRFVSSVSTALEFNQATLSGCIDVIVIEQEDGTLMCTPFHVRFGKLKVLKSKEKTVSIQVNGEEATFKMKLGAAGDGFFEEQRPHRAPEDIMSDDQSDPENYMSSEDDSELNSPRRDENQPSSPQTDAEEKRKRSKSGKKWAWLWKSTPEDAIQSEKEKEQEMQQAIEKLVRNEIGTQEKIELVHDLAKGPSVEELPQPHEPRHHHEIKTAEEREKELIKESQNTSLLEQVEDMSTHPHADDEGEDEKHLPTYSGHHIRDRIHEKLHHHQQVKKDAEQLEEAVNEDDAALKGYKLKHHPAEEKDHGNGESGEGNHHHHHGHHVDKEKKEEPIEELLKEDKKRKHKKSEEGDDEGEADAKDTDELALNVDKVNDEKVLKHDKKEDPIKQLAEDLNEKERQVKETEKEKEKKKRGILRSFLGMFKSEKDEKDKTPRKVVSSAAHLPSSAENLKKSGFKGHLTDSGKQESKQEANTESDVMSFPDEIENIEINLDENDENTHKSSKKEEEALQNGVDFPPDADIELSLCANEIDEKENEDLTAIFLKHRVPYSKFVKDPFKILSNPNLMVKIDDKLYDWKIACPLIVSLLAFKRPLPEDVLQELSEKETSATSSSWRNWFSLSKKEDKGRKEEKHKKEEKPKKDDKDKEKEKAKTASTEKAPKEQPQVEENHHREKEKRPHHAHEAGNVVMDEKPPMITEKQIIRENLAQEEMIAKAEGDTEKAERLASRQAKIRRTLRPNSEMLKTLNLKPGCNTIVYTVQGGIQGEKTLSANIYLWPANSKIIISDIDGTITKSDVLGQLMPMMGRDWSQPGVASLYSNIRKNGYQILYLTARAIGQSQLTKDFLNSITQGGFSLPPGPVILSPDRLVPSFKREIIYRKPEVFKIACLRDLRSLFPPNHNPFYAGFGNRETDAIAYQAVGMPSGKIFTINPLGEIRLLNATYSKSYVLINDMVNDMFPGIEVDDKYQASEEYNLVNYFKVNYETLVDFDVSELIN